MGTKGERRRLSPITSARACAVWCNAINERAHCGLLVDYLSFIFLWFSFCVFCCGRQPLAFSFSSMRTPFQGATCKSRGRISEHLRDPSNPSFRGSILAAFARGSIGPHRSPCPPPTTCCTRSPIRSGIEFSNGWLVQRRQTCPPCLLPSRQGRHEKRTHFAWSQ